MKREEIKKIVDNIVGVPSIVEATLERNEYYIYTEVWQLTIEQLDRIRERMKISSISVDGGRIMLTAKV